MYDEPIEGAEVEIAEINWKFITNESGYFHFDNVPIESFTVNVTRWGYTPIVEADFTFDGEMELECDIRMLHPEMVINPTEINADLPEGNTAQIDIAIENRGDGPLEFITSMRGAPMEGDFWDQLEEVNTGGITGDPRLQACIFFQDHFWITGGMRSNEPNMLYKVSRDGELVDSWEQGSYSNYGWRNLTTDGEYLYGVDSTYIAQIDPSDGQVTGVRIPTPLNPCYSCTYDPENQIFWVASVTTDIYGIDRGGNEFYRIRNNLRFRTSGLAYFEDDIHGYKLYILNNDSDGSIRLVKCNYENGEIAHVADLQVAEGERSGGCSFNNELYPFTWAFIVQMQATDDWMRTYEASSDFFWVEVTPRIAHLEPDDGMNMHLDLSTDGLELNETYNAYLQIIHNTPVEGAIWVDISMTVTENSAPFAGVDVPLEYGLVSVNPNPFNAVSTVNFRLDRASNVKLTVHDLAGRQVALLTEGHMSGGEYSMPIDGATWSSGMYLVRLCDGSRVSLKKVTLLK